MHGICTRVIGIGTYKLRSERFDDLDKAKAFVRENAEEFMEGLHFIVRFSSETPNKFNQVFMLDWHVIWNQDGIPLDFSDDRGARPIELAVESSNE